MICPNCGTHNDEGYRFCMRCGAALTQPPPPMPAAPPVEQTSPEIPAVPPLEEAGITLASDDFPAAPPQPSISAQPSEPAQPSTPATPAAPAVAPAAPRVTPPPPQGSYTPPPAVPQAGYGYTPPPQTQGYPAQQGYQTPPTGGQYQAPGYGSTGFSMANIWGPFAGYGTRRRHLGWLLDGRGDKTDELNQKVNTKFGERQLPGTAVRRAMLTARGVVVENRPYHLVQRGLVTVGLYIARFGQDLYLSIASYLKPPISNLRVILLGVMVLYWLFMTFVFPSMLNNAVNDMLSGLTGSFFGGSSGGSNALVSMICFLGPLGFVNNVALFLFVVYSLYKFIKEKDILAGLRVSPNEFNEDDLMALEKAVEQTVRISMDEIGLDFAKARPASVSELQRLI